jgi:hypothetical protein
LQKQWEPDMKYKLTLYPGFIGDIYNKGMDTLVYNFKAQKEEYYGIVHLTVSNVTGPTIIQLLDANNKFVREYSITNDTIIDMDYLHPKEYIFRAIYDDNQNG